MTTPYPTPDRIRLVRLMLASIPEGMNHLTTECAVIAAMNNEFA